MLNPAVPLAVTKICIFFLHFIIWFRSSRNVQTQHYFLYSVTVLQTSYFFFFHSFSLLKSSTSQVSTGSTQSRFFQSSRIHSDCEVIDFFLKSLSAPVFFPLPLAKFRAKVYIGNHRLVVGGKRTNMQNEEYNLGMKNCLDEYNSAATVPYNNGC